MNHLNVINRTVLRNFQKVIMEKLPNVPNVKMMFPNFNKKKSDTICIHFGQQAWRDFDFLSPAWNNFVKGEPARSQNMLPISLDKTSLKLSCTASHVNVLKRTAGGFRKASRQKKSNISWILLLFFCKKPKQHWVFWKTKKDE